MSNYSQILAIEGKGHEGVAILEKGLFHPDVELSNSSSLFTGHVERAHKEEVIVISGTITIAP